MAIVSSIDDLHIEFHNGMAAIAPQEWNALLCPRDTPFLEWEWLDLLETSQSICAKTGWGPIHIAVRRAKRLVGAAPLYIKHNSVGEFVFDFGWADVAAQIGVAYYPKLVGMVPATPSPGYRFLIAPDEERGRVTALMLKAIDMVCNTYEIHSCAFNYVDPQWRAELLEYGYEEWKHQSFEWRNEGFCSFDDYLAGFTKNQRRNIRRERKTVAEAEVRVQIVPGDQTPREWFATMYQFYLNTNEQFGPWAARHLTAAFFEGLYERFRHRLLFCCAFRGERNEVPIGMSLLIIKDDRLIGRYWGAEAFLDCLHFNVCYYSPIEWAIHNNIASFDPGIGSEHKIRRGFRAVINYSIHRFHDEQMQSIMRYNIGRINEQEEQIVNWLNAQLPFKSPGAFPGASDK